jgi:hypothetical protein
MRPDANAGRCTREESGWEDAGRLQSSPWKRINIRKKAMRNDSKVRS